MEAIRAVRRPVRIEFEKLYKELTKLLGEEVVKTNDVIVTFKIFREVFETLQQYDKEAMEHMCSEKVTTEEEDAEYDQMRAFKINYEKMKEKVMPEEPVIPYTDSIAAAGSGSTMETRLTNFKLPTIQMRKFSGQLIDWLTFWAQFEKIDEHPTLSGSDKLTYLIQLLEPGTDAHEIASGYPQTNDNYPKVVAALKKRYGNADLLLQVYIRQLLNLVISNVNTKERIPVKSLFLKLDSHLRALKSVNLEKADPATWLFPLVESCLPEKILDNWQRSPLSTQDGSKESPPRTRLNFLMAFVEKEVDIKQRIEFCFGQEG